jgi:hypothetical protein
MGSKILELIDGTLITTAVQELPRENLPRGFYLVHNHIRPAKPLGRNGFRAWVQDKAKGLVQCKCNFGGVKNAKVNKHYRVRLVTIAPIEAKRVARSLVTLANKKARRKRATG